MPMTEVEILAGFRTGNGNFYSQVASADPEHSDEVISVIAAGDTHPKMVATNGGMDAIPYETQQVALALAEHGNLGADVSALMLYYRTITSLSGRELATAQKHTRFTANKAYGYITNITAGNRREATARGRIVCVTDGTNPGLIRTGTATLTNAPTADEVFVLGSVLNKVGGNVTLFEGCDNFDVNLNPQIFEKSDESNESVTLAAGDTISPVISFTTTDRRAWDLRKTAVTDFRFHLLRKKKNGTCYLNVETQHIRGKVTQGLMLIQSITGRPAEKRVEVYASGNQANGFDDDPITWEINVAVNNL